jgi:hypothetical protein
MDSDFSVKRQFSHREHFFVRDQTPCPKNIIRHFVYDWLNNRGLLLWEGLFVRVCTFVELLIRAELFARVCSSLTKIEIFWGKKLPDNFPFQRKKLWKIGFHKPFRFSWWQSKNSSFFVDFLQSLVVKNIATAHQLFMEQCLYLCRLEISFFAKK